MNALTAMRTMRKFSSAEYKRISQSLKEMTLNENIRRVDLVDNLSSPRDISEFHQRFESVTQVGSGSFGSVYKIREKTSQELAAAKYLRQTKQQVKTVSIIHSGRFLKRKL